MKEHPYHLPRSSDWCLEISPGDTEALTDCPGLRVTPEACYGAVDAIIAACFRLKKPEPTIAPGNGTLVTRNYTWDYKPRDYQKEGIARVIDIQNTAGGAVLADEMGLGKTFQTIHLAKIRRSQSSLVACPGLTRETWLDELQKWGVPSERIALVLPKGAKKREHYRQRIATGQAQWVVTSYELLDQIPELGYYTDNFIMDEAQYVKSAGSKDKAAARAIKALEVGTLAPYRLALSGTPADDKPKDWYGVLKVLFRKRLGTQHEFQVAYCDGHQGKHGFEAEGISRQDELRKRLAVYTVRREKRDVAKELPGCHLNPVWLDPEDSATATFRAWVLKLATIEDALEACLEAKIPLAISKAHEAKRFLLFTYRREHAERMAKRLNYEGTPCVLVTGEVPHDKRQALVREAADRGIGMVATFDSAGMSLNLQGIASYGIWHAMTWRPGKLMQGVGRLDRLGQVNTVQWDFLALRDSADEHVWNTVIHKLKMQMEAMQSTKAIGTTIDALSTIPSALTDEDAMKAMYDALPEGVVNVDMAT